MRELITQILGMVIGSSILSIFGFRGMQPATPIKISKSKIGKVRMIIVAVVFLIIIGLALFQISVVKGS